LGGAFGVMRGLLLMNRAVDFHRQAMFGVVEIQYVAPANVLSPELEASQLPVAKAIPEHFFGGRFFAAQAAGNVDGLAPG
jgi:hypothetical protein